MDTVAPFFDSHCRKYLTWPKEKKLQGTLPFNKLKALHLGLNKAGLWSDFRLDIIDTATDSEESISRHVSVQTVDILNTFCEQTCKQFAFFMCFGSSGFCPSCQVFTVLMLDGR